MIKNVVFDMDGTILNTIDDIANSVNYALKKCAYPTRSMAEVLSFVGNGVKVLMQRAVPNGLSEADFDKCFAEFMAHYNIHKNDNTAPYDGILELMAELDKQGVKMSVVSNKFDAGVKELAKNLFAGYLPVAIGESEKVMPKPNPSGVWYAMELMGANKNDTVYIGDSEVDYQTAKNSEITFIAVTWGFRPRSLHEQLGVKNIAEKPLDIVEILKKIMIAKFGLLGGKLGHSLSPFIHNLLFEASGMRAEYKLYEAKSVQEFLNNYPTLDGFNITIPYKKDIVCHCTKLDKSAKSLGVVNCVDKNMVGYNTDVYGYTKSVGELGINNNSKVLLLGCGGVGSMIAKQYKPENLVIAVRNISKEKVNRIKLEFGNVEVIDIAKLKDEFNDLVEQNDALNVNNLICEEQFDLVVNSTPCGMYPNVEDSPIDENAVKLAKACYDTIYNPYTTKLLEISQQAGLKCKNGLEMLVLQAVKSHEYWYGGSFKQNDIEQIISLTAKELEK